MKNYQKAEMIAKNLPTGSYAAGCPTHTSQGYGAKKPIQWDTCGNPTGWSNVSCADCEVAQ